MSNPVLNKGSVGCSLGLFLIIFSFAFGILVLVKCFGPAYQHNYSLPEYISALFTRDAMKLYLVAGFIFFIGLFLSINGVIRILKDFFEV